MRSKCLLGLVAALCLVAMPLVASAAPVTIASGAQGWVKSDGETNGGYNGANTFTGNILGFRYNSWASFDLSALLSPISSGVLKLDLERWPFNEPEAYTLDIHDVANTADYADLMTGAYFGSVTGNNGVYFVTLNAAALAAINANLGGSVAFGFTNATLNLENPAGVDLGIYINGFSWAGQAPGIPPELHLDSNAVPDAGSSLLLLGMALAGLRAARKRLP